MAENIITNANDVELVLSAGGDEIGTSPSLGRMVVDDFSITRNDDTTLVSSVGMHLPAGLSEGDITFEWSFTMLGSDKDVFEKIAAPNGRGRIFSITARKTDDSNNLQWEFALDTCKATDDEFSASSGDPTEYAVSGVAVSVDRQT